MLKLDKIEKEKPELNFEKEEADTRIVSHVNDAVKNRFEKIVIASNNMLVITKKWASKKSGFNMAHLIKQGSYQYTSCLLHWKI